MLQEAWEALEAPTKELRTERIYLRVKPSVKSQLQGEAENMNMKLSSYIRMKLFAKFEGVGTITPRSKPQQVKDISKGFTPEFKDMVQELKFVFSGKIEIENGFVKPSSIKSNFKDPEIDVKLLEKKKLDAARRMWEKESRLHPPCAPPEE